VVPRINKFFTSIRCSPIPDLPPAAIYFRANSSRFSCSESIPLRAAWNFGIEKEIITSNPFKGVEIIKSGHDLDPDVLTEEEKNQILVHLKGVQNVLGYVLLRWAALRRDEALRNVR